MTGSDWRIYYDDGTTYEGVPELAPERGLQVILQLFDRDGELEWGLYRSTDYYIWNGPLRWLGVDIFGLFDYLAKPGWKRVLFGRTITNEQHDLVYYRAKADRDYAKQHGHLPE